MSKIRVNLIGYNYWGPNVARNLTRIDDCTIEYITDLSANARARAKKDYHNIDIISTVDKALSFKNAFDAVCIVTPIETHYELVKKCLLSKKHVFCEKPLCQTYQQAVELSNLAKSLSLVLCVGHVYCYHPAINEIKSKLNSIGTPYYYKSTRVNLGRFCEDSNVCWDLLPHDISILLYLFPNKKINYISANGFCNINKNLIDEANINIVYEDGFHANIDINWVSARKVREITIGGSDKTIVYDDCKVDNKVSYYDSGISIGDHYRITYRKGDLFSPKISETEALFHELKNFIDCIKSNWTPICDGEQGLKVVEIIEKTLLSIFREGEPVYL